MKDDDLQLLVNIVDDSEVAKEFCLYQQAKTKRNKMRFRKQALISMLQKRRQSMQQQAQKDEIACNKLRRILESAELRTPTGSEQPSGSGSSLVAQRALKHAGTPASTFRSEPTIVLVWEKSMGKDAKRKVNFFKGNPNNQSVNHVLREEKAKEERCFSAKGRDLATASENLETV